MKSIVNLFAVSAMALLATVSCGGPKAGNAIPSEDGFYTMTNANGMSVTVTSFGGRIQAINIPDKNGVVRDVVLGFDTMEEYYPENNSSDFGASIGRYANRIAGAKFSLDGQEYALSQNNFTNCLHGGATGWQYQPYQVVEADASHVKVCIVSPDGDNGFPGEVTAYTTYTLTDDNKIVISYEATTTAPTVINMTNHSYFNLSGDPANHSVVDDILYINSSAFTPIDRVSIPLPGDHMAVEGTPFDFRTPTRVGDRIDNVDFEQILVGTGYDHNWVLDTKGDINALAAKVTCPETGISVSVYTDEPGVQVYTGNFLDGTVTGKGGIKYNKRAGICLETQHYPDSPNRDDYPSVVLRPGETYTSSCIYAFEVEK